MSLEMESTDWDLLFSYAGLLVLACGAVYTGSFGSLPNPKRTDGSPRTDDDDDEILERVSSGDAWMFPVIGSIALLGFYLVIKYLGKEWINWLLGWYFSFTGVASVWRSLISLTRFFLGEKTLKRFGKPSSLIVKANERTLLSVAWRPSSLFMFPLAVIPSALYSFSKSFRHSALITDILGLSFAHNAVSLLKIDSFNTGAILLIGLFFYDVWWVFGTEVMVKVATTLDVPIKLLWPKSLVFSNEHGFTMLGLGDIVVPGTLIAFALRYDYHRSLQSKAPRSGSFSKPYFCATLTAYFLGLVTTMTVMHFFKAAQPALLYLSPACVSSFLLTAAVRGELREALMWSDSPDASQPAAEKKAN
ncbi:hypothetical protein H0H92_001960 [Tricholoma furcatifolium]|nr:hypothetical protein H0H92_001960 [Tricholoma furcatifolium]